MCVNVIGEELFHSKNQITINKRCEIQATVSTDSMSEWGAELNCDWAFRIVWAFDYGLGIVWIVLVVFVHRHWQKLRKSMIDALQIYEFNQIFDRVVHRGFFLSAVVQVFSIFIWTLTQCEVLLLNISSHCENNMTLVLCKLRTPESSYQTRL